MPAISAYGMRRAFGDPAIYKSSFGYTARSPAWDALVETYLPATLMCGKQPYNLLVERKHAPLLPANGIAVGEP